VIGAVPERIEAKHIRGFGVVGAIEQQQLHSVGPIGIDAEVDAAARRRCAERMR